MPCTSRRTICLGYLFILYPWEFYERVAQFSAGWICTSCQGLGFFLGFGLLWLSSTVQNTAIIFIPHNFIQSCQFNANKLFKKIVKSQLSYIQILWILLLNPNFIIKGNFHSCICKRMRLLVKLQSTESQFVKLRALCF